jgi:spore germination protein YaaH
MTLAPDAPPPTRVMYKAGRNDSVASVARRFGVTPAQAAQWNNVQPGASFKPGHMIVAYTSRPQQVLQSTRTRVVSNAPGQSTASELRKAAALAAAAEAEADKAAAAARSTKTAGGSKAATIVKTVAAPKSPTAEGKVAASKATAAPSKTAKGASSKNADTAAASSANSRTRMAQSGAPAARP